MPFALLGDPAGLWAWTALLIGCIRRRRSRSCRSSAPVRWCDRCCWPGSSWPVVYSIKLGQVGPILLLLFALGWRWLDQPIRLGASDRDRDADQDPAGAALVVWAVLTGSSGGRPSRRSSVVVAVGRSSTLPLVGLGAWSDYVTLLRSVSEPITTPHNFTPGAIALPGWALDAGTASVIQLAGRRGDAGRGRRGRARR